MLKSFTRLLFIVGTALSIAATVAVAGDNVTADQIVKALQPRPLTRGLSAAAPVDPTVAATQTRFLASLRPMIPALGAAGLLLNCAQIAIARQNSPFKLPCISPIQRARRIDS